MRVVEKSINFLNYFRLSKSSHILDDDVKLIIIFIIITQCSRARCAASEWKKVKLFFHLWASIIQQAAFTWKGWISHLISPSSLYHNLFGLETGFSSLQHQPKWNVIYFQLDQRAAVRQFRVAISWRCCFSNRLSVLMHPTISSQLRLGGKTAANQLDNFLESKESEEVQSWAQSQWHQLVTINTAYYCQLSCLSK